VRVKGAGKLTSNLQAPVIAGLRTNGDFQHHDRHPADHVIIASPLSIPLTPQSLTEIRRRCFEQLLGLHKKAHAGHIGSSLSCLEILVDLCFHRMGSEDVIVLSKGHAAGALYTTLSLSGRLPEASLDTFYQEGTLLSAHPPCSGQIKAIPFGTGSLGHGLGLACGIALAQRFTGQRHGVYAILSDGDCNEGSTWEAALFAAHQKLPLTVIIDLNGLQGIGFTRDILNLEPIAEKWRAFGFSVAVADNGNDFSSLADAHARLQNASSPRCIIARTTKGHGVSYMQNRMEWHYLPMNDEQFAQALKEPRLSTS
jgi:transketolase